MAPVSSQRWERVAPGVWVVRHRDLDLTTGVVIGSVRVLVVDTGEDLMAGAALLAGLAEVEPEAAGLPRDVVYTHAHYDHCFGTAALVPTGAWARVDSGTAALWPAQARARVDSGTAALGSGQVWAHEGCLAELRSTGELQRETVVAQYRSTGRQAAAERVAAVHPVLPTRVFSTSATLDLGGREVQLLHLGAGHTDHDAVVLVADADVLFAGDLLENGAPPGFDDARPADWPVTLGRALELLGPTALVATFVPGHGDPVDAAFVTRQRAELAAVAAACATGTTDAGPYPAAVMRTALAAFRSAQSPPGAAGSASPPR